MNEEIMNNGSAARRMGSLGWYPDVDLDGHEEPGGAEEYIEPSI
jgi:hypothetical protein